MNEIKLEKRTDGERQAYLEGFEAGKRTEKRGKWEEVNQIIDQSEYELLDGIGMPYHARTFSAEEYDTIKGVVEYIRKAFESEE